MADPFGLSFRGTGCFTTCNKGVPPPDPFQLSFEDIFTGSISEQRLSAVTTKGYEAKVA